MPRWIADKYRTVMAYKNVSSILEGQESKIFEDVLFKMDTDDHDILQQAPIFETMIKPIA